MAFAIGLRFYRVAVRRKADRAPMMIGPGAEPCDLLDYAAAFVAKKLEPTIETSESRTWFFEPSPTNSIRTVHGHINYGTHGFESKFKDVATREEKYQRKSSDLEEIPLYFQIWAPSESEFALMAFQSFQGRSCVSFVRSAMIQDFEATFPGYALTFRVIASTASFQDTTPVKAITFLRPNTASDKADAYRLGRRLDEVDYEVTVKAKKRGATLAMYKDLQKVLAANKDGYVEFDGHEYASVRADIKTGNKRRTVGVFGSGYDAGLIDVSDEVKRHTSGHPVLESIESEVDILMEDFYSGMKT